jgi:hypothetical protein
MVAARGGRGRRELGVTLGRVLVLQNEKAAEIYCTTM